MGSGDINSIGAAGRALFAIAPHHDGPNQHQVGFGYSTTKLTASAIAEPVSIVHIPVDVAQAYATQLYWTINRAPVDSAAFFNLTSNRIEVRAQPSNSRAS